MAKNNKNQVISKILLPIDGSEHSKRAIYFTGYLVKSMKKVSQGITLLSVVTGRYMRRSIPYFDFRAEILKLSDSFTKSRDRYVENKIKPALDEGIKILFDIGIKTSIKKLIVDGEPSQEIVRIADEGNFSTIIMARRGISGIMGILLGSITNKVVHSAVGQTVYVVGQKIPKDKKCPVSKILVPVDGSPYSIKGIEHIAGIAHELKDCIKKITLLRVINLAFFEKRIIEGIDLEKETKNIIEEAKKNLLDKGIKERTIITKVRIGTPAEEIVREAQEGNYNLIAMGRKGRTAFKEFILGGVSSTVLQRCHNPTIAIVSSNK